MEGQGLLQWRAKGIDCIKERLGHRAETSIGGDSSDSPGGKDLAARPKFSLHWHQQGLWDSLKIRSRSDLPRVQSDLLDLPKLKIICGAPRGRSAENHIAPGQELPLGAVWWPPHAGGDRMSHQLSPKRGSFPADGQENGAILSELRNKVLSHQGGIQRASLGISTTARKRSGLVLEASSPSASRKSVLKYPLKSPVLLYSLPNTKRRKSPQCGQQCCGGDGKSPCPAHGILLPFAPGSFVLKRPWLIKRGRNNGNILFLSQGMVQRLPHLWRPCQHQLPRCGCLM